MPDFSVVLSTTAEAVKIIGGLASFYAVVKLRQIERRYLFKATVPELIKKIEDALSVLSIALVKPSDHRADLTEAMNYLLVDVKNIRRKARGDSLKACNELLAVIRSARPARHFWQSEGPMLLNKTTLLDVYGKGRGLVRSLENDMQDQGWGAK
jgi:hypothetical protein